MDNSMEKPRKEPGYKVCEGHGTTPRWSGTYDGQGHAVHPPSVELDVDLLVEVTGDTRWVEDGLV